MSDSVKVAIKVRPLIKRERDENLQVQWLVNGSSIAPLDPELRRRAEPFYFDHIFDVGTTNENVFDIVAKPIVEAAVNGFNGTIFAYGQTSSGKTFTMMGDTSSSQVTNSTGVIPLAINYIFDTIANTYGREFLLRVSYIEIYNEKINDLLNKDGTDLKIKEDPKSGQAHVLCKEEVINCPEKVLAIMRKGDKNRSIGETNMNERSSRSHTIFRITIESREAKVDSEAAAVHVSQLNLVDLAGSERARQSGATGDRFNEGRHINLSLLSLGLVIMQLSETQDNPQRHVNFRDSKLTRILQSSLGGNAMTAIICAVTPVAFEETQCTLAFASRAKKIQNKPQVNEVVSDATLIKRYAKQLAKLKEELERADAEKESKLMEKDTKLKEKEIANQLLQERIDLLETRIVGGNIGPEAAAAERRAKRRRTWGGGTLQTKIAPFQMAGSLPTIKETEKSPEKKWNPERVKRRQSIIHSSDYYALTTANQTFTTAFEDFELELIETERANDRLSDVCNEDNFLKTVTKRPNRGVKFNDEDAIIDEMQSRNDKISERKSPQPESPGTPKSVLRKRISFLAEEYYALTEDHRSLEEFSNLEKQMFVDEAVEAAMADHKKELESLQKALAESERARQEILQKYAKINSNESETRFADVESKEKKIDADELPETSESKTSNLKNEKETSSIFANDSYFDGMNDSDLPCDSIFANDTQNTTEISEISATTNKLDDSKTSKNITNFAYGEFIRQINGKSSDELLHFIQDIYGNKVSLEEENAKLKATLADQIRESEDVKNDIRELKCGIEKLQETIQLLTNENTDLTSKLTNEKESEKKSLQCTIAELNTSIHTIFQEFDSKSSKTLDKNDKTMALINSYKRTIDSLTTENVELSTNLMNKIEELDRLKEVESSPHDHDCAYRELTKNLSDRNKILENENIDLSNNLMEKIEEYDRLKEKYDSLNIKYSSSNSSDDTTNLIEISINEPNKDDVLSVSLDTPRKKVSTRENEFFATGVDDLLRFSLNNESSIIDNVEKKNNRNIDDLLKMSIICDEKNIDDDLGNGETVEKSNDSTSNVESSTSCKKCEHFIELRENRKVIKNEMKILTNTLRDLQMKYERDFADTEILRTKASENLNYSVSDSTLNSSMNLEGSALNVSHVEERVNIMKNELDAVRANHDKLTMLYREKCEEIEKLHNDSYRESPSSNDSPRIGRKDAKLDEIHAEIEKLQCDLKHVKKHVKTVSGALKKFVDKEKSMLNEIETLKLEKLELEGKFGNAYCSANADEKIRFLENEVYRLKSEIEDLNGVKLQLEETKLSLESAVESRQMEKEKPVQIKTEKSVEYPQKMDYSLMEEKIKSLEREVARLTSEIENSNVVKLQLEDAKSLLVSEVESLKIEKENSLKIDLFAQEKIELLERDIARLTSEIENSNVVKLQLEEAKSSLEIENESLKIQKEKSEENSLKIDLVAQEKIGSLDHEVTRLTSEIESSNVVKLQLEDAKSLLASEVESLKIEKEKAEENSLKIDLIAQEKIELLERDIARLTSEIENSNVVKLQLEEAKSLLEIENESLKIQKEKFNENSLKIDFSLAQEKIGSLEHEVTRLTSEIDSSNVVKLQLEDAKSSLESEIESLKIEKEKSEENSLKIDLVAQEKIESLEHEVARLTSEIESSNVVKRQLEDAKTSLESEVESLKIEKEKSEENSLKIDLMAQEKIQSLEHEVTRLTSEIENSNVVKLQLEDSKASLESEVESLKIEKDKSAENSLKIEFALAREKIESLEREVTRLTSEIQNSNVIKLELEKEKSLLGSEVESLKIKEENSLKIDLSLAREKIELLEREVARFTLEIKNSDKTKRELEEAKSWLEAKLQSVKTEKEVLDEKLAKMETSSLMHEKIASLENEATRLCEELDIANSMKTTLENAKSSLESQIDTFKIEQNVRDEIIQKLQRSLETLEEKDTNHRTTFKFASENDKIIDNSSSTFSNIVDSPNNNFESDEKIISSLREKLRDTIAELTSYIDINAELNDRLAEIEKTNNELITVKSRLEDEISCLINERTSNETRMKIVSENLEKLQDENSTLTVVSETLRIELKNMKNDLNECTKQNEELKRKFTENEEFALKINENEESMKVLVKNECHEEECALIEKISILKSVIQKLENENTSLRNELERTENSAKLNETSKNHENYENTIEELQSKLHNVTEELDLNVKENVEMSNELTKLNSTREELNDAQLSLEIEIEKLNAEKRELDESVKNLRSEVSELREKNVSLTEKLREKSMSDEFLENSRNEKKNVLSDERLTNLAEKIAACTTENEELRSKISKLENQSSTKNLEEELESARKVITKEIKALRPSSDINLFSEKSTSELFELFVTTIMSKEQELMKSLSDNFERERRKLEDSKSQSIDAEKRAILWAKEVEAEIERTQQEVTNHEKARTELQKKIDNLENVRKELEHERQMLNEKMHLLEVDYNTLQADLDKSPQSRRSTTLNVTQENERFMRESVETREMELSSKLRTVEKNYKEKIDELTSIVEYEKNRNIELTINLEGLEANERQLKNIVDMRSNEIAKLHDENERLENELGIITESHRQSCDDNIDYKRQIDEITCLLKGKCDKLSEYKTMLETIRPEYENLKEQTSERNFKLEKYKSEIECMRTENERNISSLKDRLDAEEIKCSGYRKQLVEMANRNTVLQTEIVELKTRCEELEITNGKLSKSMRNSTSRIRAEAEIEELRDRCRTLEINFEGAGNRINELQDIKTRLMKDLVDLRATYETTRNENEDIKSAMSSHRSSIAEMIELRDKYENLMREKNRTDLELEEKKSLYAQMEKKIHALASENEDLRNKNKELDDEMEDIVVHIHDLRKENAEFEDKLFTITGEIDNSPEIIDKWKKRNEELEERVKMYETEIAKLKSREDKFLRDNEATVKKTECLSNENLESRGKLSNLDRGDNISGCESTRSSSPTIEAIRIDNRRRRSRNDLFNMNRPAEVFANDNENNDECRCNPLKQQVTKLEQDLALKKAKICTLELEIQSEMFPHMKKCKDLEEMLASCTKKNKQMKAEMRKLEERRSKEMSSECERCRKWRTNKCDQASQCMPEMKPICMSGMSSGFVEEYNKMAKLEADKATLKNVCRSRQKKIFELEERIRELEKLADPKIIDEKLTMNDSSTPPSTTPKCDSSNSARRPMKENVPAIWDDQKSLLYSRRDWFN